MDGSSKRMWISPQQGLPNFLMVGPPATVVNEARYVVR